MSFLAHWLITAVSLVFADWVLDGVRLSGAFALAFGALALGFVNALIRPIMLLLTLPLTLLTFGLFALVINGAAFGLAAFLVPGFTVTGFAAAFWGALLTGLVSWAVGSVGIRRARGR